MSYGLLTLGRLTLRETFAVSETGGDTRSLSVSGEESTPPLTRAALIARHDDLLALETGSLIAATWTDKPDRNGFYTVKSSSAELDDVFTGAVVTSGWKVDLNRVGSEAETDIESRLTGTIRENNFSLTGERWHAPSIGHYAYHTGSSIPTVLNRASADGAITVYRSIPSGVSPRWGVAPGDYAGGRVRVRDGSVERSGVNTTVSASGWELSNALVRVNVAPAGSGSLEVAAYDGSAWESKYWNVSVAASGAPIELWDGATILRNDYEQAVIRLTHSLSPGRVTLDLTLRRGSRFVEGYLQRSDANTLSAYLAAGENVSDFASGGYVVATDDDSGGNRFTAGTAHTFTPHASGGLSRAATRSLDFYLGAVIGGGSAVSGDAATDLRNQYIGALAEFTTGVRR